MSNNTGTTKILWHSVCPWAPTGYGQQTSLFAPRIAALDNIDLAISSGFGLQGGPIKWNGLHVYPGEDWNRTVYQWAMHHGNGDPCTVITLFDVWPLDVDVYRAIDQQGRLACWVPVDHNPAPPAVVNFLRESGAIPIAMSRFGETQLREAGLDPLYVPHGIDTEMFAPSDKPELAKFRELLEVPQDAFIVGMVANNQGQSPARKSFSESFMAFSVFQQTHPDAILHLHTEMTGFRNGLNLYRMLERFEIPPEAIRLTEQVRLEHVYPPAAMAGLYNLFDVLLNPSYGEGFGIPIVEAQACGTPVIVTDWTSMPELVGAGWKVGGIPWDHAMAEAFWMKPDIDAIVDALELAYESRGDEVFRARARKFAVDYDVNKVMSEYWEPALERIHSPREVKPIGPNRAMRRAKERVKV
jgi:glycosyltransferase involved in cell wall biosynthesis